MSLFVVRISHRPPPHSLCFLFLSNDDPNQPLGTDKATLIMIMEAANNRTKQQSMIHLVGFVPWKFKYVDAKHQGVATEWEMVQLLTAYNVFVDADACCLEAMANAAFFRLLPLSQPRFVQPAPLNRTTLQALGYLAADGKTVVPRLYSSFYVGDYDSAAWLYSQIRLKWDDPARGQVPLGWAVDPELYWRFPVAFEYLLSTQSAQDRLIVGDSGAGYINPTQLLPPRSPSNYPSGVQVWQQHNAPLYQLFDQRFSGFLLNGQSGSMTSAAELMYQNFSGRGAVDELGGLGSNDNHMDSNNFVVLVQQDLPGNGDVQAAAQAMAAR